MFDQLVPANTSSCMPAPAFPYSHHRCSLSIFGGSLCFYFYSPSLPPCYLCAQRQNCLVSMLRRLADTLAPPTTFLSSKHAASFSRYLRPQNGSRLDNFTIKNDHVRYTCPPWIKRKNHLTSTPPRVYGSKKLKKAA
jgi:hypothetical protein